MTHLQRVCILTPGQIGSNPRVVKEADALFEAGYNVAVIATRALDRLEPRDRALMRRIHWRLERVDLRGMFRRKFRRLRQATARQLFRAKAGARFANLAHHAATPALMARALATPADLYIAHYPAALPAAVAAARRYNVRYGYDAEDFHPGEWPPTSEFEAERRLVHSIESRYLPGVAYVTAAAPLISDAYAVTYGARPHVVLNVFPRRQAPAAPSPRGDVSPGPSLYWFSQTIGPNRGLEAAVRAIGAARTRPHLYLRGTLSQGYGAQLETLAREVGAGGRIHILPPAEPDEMERLASRHDLGLCGEIKHSENQVRALSNKLFSFVLAGTPPLMSDTDAQRAFAAEAGLTELLYPIGDAEALAGQLDRWLGDCGALAWLRERVWRLGQERYNWDVERAGLLEKVEAALSSVPTGTGGQDNGTAQVEVVGSTAA